MLVAVIHSLLQQYRTRRTVRYAAWTLFWIVATWVISSQSAPLPGPLRITLISVSLLATAYSLVRLIGALRVYMMWHLRRRLVVTYIFIAVVPVALILILVWLAGVMLNGQFAAFLVNLNLHNQVEDLRQVNRVVTHEAHLTSAKSARDLVAQVRRFYVQELSTHADSYPGLQIAIKLGPEEKAFYLNGGPLPRAPVIPSWLHREEFADVVADGGTIYLRAVVVGRTSFGPITMILSEPFSPELLDIVGSKIGPVGVVFNPREQGLHISPVTGSLAGKLPQPAETYGATFRSDSVALPAPANFLDMRVFGTSALNPVRWEESREERGIGPVFVYVNSRLSTLTGQLFGTLGRYSHVYVALFLVIAAGFLVIELLSLIVGIRLTQTITGTVDKLYDATERIKAGNLEHRINLPARDQLSSLGEAFDAMTASLRRLVREAHEKTALEHEIKIAQEVQQHLLPSTVPEVPGLKLCGVCKPARGVSGDYYDFLPIGKNRLGIVVGDVSGKGISAALIMSSVQALVKTRLYLESPPDQPLDSAALSTAKFFENLNQQMFENTPEEKYATCFYALYDAPSRRLLYTNAGHPPPLLFRKGSITKLDAGGTPLGLISPASYERAELTLEPGDLFIAFSDGLTEAENSFEEQFGVERLIEVIQRAEANSLEALMEEIYEAVEHWTGTLEPQDDMTLIIARICS